MTGKKLAYVSAFAVLGFLVQFVVHAALEIAYIRLLLADFEAFGLGLSFATWFLIHGVYAAVLLVTGIMLGVWQGFYWWHRVYGTLSGVPRRV